MIVRNAVVDNIINMAYEDKNLNPFGKRYIGDMRYRVYAIAGSGNGHRDTVFGYVGNIQFELILNYDYHRVMGCRLLSRAEYFNI